MMRYTEYHAGKAVIKDKSLLPQAMEKLAKVEDMNHIPEICCDEYCKYPRRCRSQAEMDQICDVCKLAELFDLLLSSGEENQDLVEVENMNMKSWAEREVEIACKYENPDRKEGEWDYGCACYESALKAFKSLMEDGHSGLSIAMTKHILNRLIDYKPLFPIEDTDDVWEYIGGYGADDQRRNYQCKRMSSLFKNVYPDGTVKYSDNNRVVMIETTSDTTWHNGLTSRIVEELFPLTMPYMPADKPYRVYCEECLTDPKNGDYDTIAVGYILKPDGERVEVNRYFKDGDSVYGVWDEIDREEYEERKEMDRKRKLELCENN